MQRRRWIRTAALVVAAATATAVVAGATFERVARARARHEIVMPGRYVALEGDRRLQLDCRGAGAPTVVLESGLDPYGSLSWSAVHDSLAGITRTCAYSRAGIMWSDPAPPAFDVRRAARDLREALRAGGESAPFVMVGHSIGVAYIMTFTQRFADEVAGIVFVDGSHPDQLARMQEATGRSLAPSATVPRIGAALAWTGLVRALPSAPTPATWPAVVGRVAPAFLPTSLGALSAETEAVPATLDAAGTARVLGDRPLVVLASTQPIPASDLATLGLTVDEGVRLDLVRRVMHREQAAWSSQGRLVELPDASHYIQFDRPDAVIAAVREVVGRVRAPASP